MPGIGRKTAQLLWNHFNSVAEMKEATAEKLANIPGIGTKKAEAIVQALKTL